MSRVDHISRILGHDSEPGEVKAEANAAPLITPDLVDYLVKTFPVPTFVDALSRAENGEQCFAALGAIAERERIINHFRVLSDAQRRK